jgi:hypothetical protein
MAKLDTPEDWWKLVDTVEPQLWEYGLMLGVGWPHIFAVELMASKDHEKLWHLLNDFWYALPDIRAIRTGPFFDLCDLCSEYPVCFGGDHDSV